LPKLHRRVSQKVPAPKKSLNEFEQRREVPVEQAIDLCVPILLSLIALLAVWMPATHASRLDPQEALRIE